MELGRCGSKQIQSHEKTVLGTWFCQLCKGGDCLPDATFIDAQESNDLQVFALVTRNCSDNLVVHLDRCKQGTVSRCKNNTKAS